MSARASLQHGGQCPASRSPPRALWELQWLPGISRYPKVGADLEVQLSQSTTSSTLTAASIPRKALALGSDSREQLQWTSLHILGAQPPHCSSRHGCRRTLGAKLPSLAAVLHLDSPGPPAWFSPTGSQHGDTVGSFIGVAYLDVITECELWGYTSNMPCSAIVCFSESSCTPEIDYLR